MAGILLPTPVDPQKASGNARWPPVPSKGRTDEIARDRGDSRRAFRAGAPRAAVSSTQRKLCLQPYTEIMSDTPRRPPADARGRRPAEAGARRIRARRAAVAARDLAGDGCGGRGAGSHLAGPGHRRHARGRGRRRRRTPSIPGEPDDVKATGKPAPLHFTLKDMNGADVKLASFKGKVILLNFWATWCGPCKAEIPSLVELQQQYADDLVVLGFSVDDTVDKMKPYAAQYKINYPLLVGNGREDVQEAFGPLFGIPVSVIIGRDGKIAKKHSGIATKVAVRARDQGPALDPERAAKPRRAGLTAGASLASGMIRTC